MFCDLFTCFLFINKFINEENGKSGGDCWWIELVIVIAVIAILAGVLIPTFGNVIEKANASAAYQEAKNAWTQYLTNVDYSTGTAEEDLVIVVSEGKYFVKVTDGKIDATATKVTDSVTIPTGYTKELLDLDKTAGADGVFGETAQNNG